MSDEDLFYQPNSIHNQSRDVDWKQRAEEAEARVRVLETDAALRIEIFADIATKAQLWEKVKKRFRKDYPYELHWEAKIATRGDTLEQAVERLEDA